MNSIQHATFLVDPILPFAIVAALIAFIFRRDNIYFHHWLTMNVGHRHIAAQITMLIFGVIFFGVAELPCYFDLSWMPPPTWTHGHATCNHFMWHGYFAWPFGNPPIPSYNEWWSWPWLILNFAFQITVGSLTIYQVFFSTAFSNRNADNWSRPKQ